MLSDKQDGSNASVICKEVFDEGYQPSTDEINEYALKIGIDPDLEPHLLGLAKEGLMRALPSEWKICYNDKLHAHYYYNERTKVTQWDHPLDAVYRSLVNKERLKLDLEINEAFPAAEAAGGGNSEEASFLDSGIRSFQGCDDSELNPTEFLETVDPRMNHLLKSSRFSELKSEKFSETIQSSRFEVTKIRPQIGLDMKFRSDSGPGADLSWPHIDNTLGLKNPEGFTLMGTGARFLKSNTKNSSGEITKTAEKEGPNVIGSNYFETEPGVNINVKGILRDSSLTDMRRRFEDPEGAEDKKSVRFNLDETKLRNVSISSFGREQKSFENMIDCPEDSNHSEDDEQDNWDFMEDNKEEHKNGKRELMIDRASKPSVRILKPLQQSQPGSNDQFVMQERNDVKPLYDDTDSDSRGSSVRSFIQKSGNLENIEVHAIMEAHQARLQELRQKLQNEFEIEEKRLRNEMQTTLESKYYKTHERIESNRLEFEPKSLPSTTESGNKAVRLQSIITTDSTVEEKVSELQNRILAEEEHFKSELRAKIQEAQEAHQNNIHSVQEQYVTILEKVKASIEDEQNQELDDFRNSMHRNLDTKKNKIVEEHKAQVDILQRNHAEIVADLERDLKSEEELLKKEHATSLQQMRDKLRNDLETERQRMREHGEDRLFEKIRCEKRLLEDKYRCLKEKYIRLKTDVKISLERRNRRREQQQVAQTQSHTNTATTGSETERSISNKPSIGNREPHNGSLSYRNHGKPPANPKNQSHFKDDDRKREKSFDTHSRERKMGLASKYIRQLQAQNQEDTTSISQSDTTLSNNYIEAKFLHIPYNDNGNSDSEALHLRGNQENNNNQTRERQRKKVFTRTKSASTSRLNTENFILDRPCTPVENLRRQLQKLEDLEDQFPDNTLETPYHLRYPFSDISNEHAGSGGGSGLGTTSSELEFFKHRIHLERDSVRRAKESLRIQRTNFRTRQREIKQPHGPTVTHHTLDHLINEEKELSEMEVSLHRTRAILGEKVIRLQHLEQSLQRIYEKDKPMEFLAVQHKDDATLSDLSSHSSSGFSSTDFHSEMNHQTNINRRKDIYQDSSECIQNLEILNLEIREILDILGKQKSQGFAVNPQLVCSDSNWSSSLLPFGSQAQTNISAAVLHAPQSIPTLADRLETYRQMAAGRVQGSMGGALMAANTIVSQSPRAVNYTTSLVERTRDLRNWLRQAKTEHDILSETNSGTAPIGLVTGGSNQIVNVSTGNVVGVMHNTKL